MENKYLVIDQSILPEVYLKVIKVKDLLKTGQAKGITDAVRKVGLSRSAYYKYNDYVFKFSEDTKGKKVTITFLLSHQLGVLSRVLNSIASQEGNILTINQGIPINDLANVSITFDIANLIITIEEMIGIVRDIEGVLKLELISMGY